MVAFWGSFANSIIAGKLVILGIDDGICSLRRHAPLDTTILCLNAGKMLPLISGWPDRFRRAVALLVDAALMGVLLFVLTLIPWDSWEGLLESDCCYSSGLPCGGDGGLTEAFSEWADFGQKVPSGFELSRSRDWRQINAGQAFLRNILRSADLFPPFYPGVVSMLFAFRACSVSVDLWPPARWWSWTAIVSPRSPLARIISDGLRQQILCRYRPDAAVLEALAAYVGRREELSPARRRELSQVLAQHFIRVWSLPAKTDPDHVLCAIYEHSTTNEGYWETRNQ